jgi:hypothetical protein
MFSIAENLNLHQVGKKIQFLFQKMHFSCKFHGIKSVPVPEAEMKSILLSLK